MSKKDPLVRTSKFLSMVLRHNPGAIGITLDEAGWVGVQDLLDAMAKAKRETTLDQLQKVVAENNKKRFEFSEDGSKIRARQGHSVQVDLGYEPQDPPEFLYHGTATRFLPKIRGEKQGLLKGQRHHVHLSADTDTAKNVGSRHGKPVVLTVRSKEMVEAGHQFFLSNNGVWLTEHVPVEFLDLPWERS